MKLIGSVAGIIFVSIMVVLLLFQAQKRETDVTLQKARVAFFMNGNHEDHSWGESHYKGMELAAEKLNLDVTYYENTMEDSSISTKIEQAIANGAKIVICNSFGFGKYALSVAAKHPEVKFFHATGVENAPNFSTYFGRIYQMRYLSGIVAGLQTKTNAIGYMAAFDIPEVNRGINAFTLGVRKVNPDAQVFVHWSRSWVDESLAEDATQDLFEKHNVDVLTVHSDALSPYEVAQSRNAWIIGYNMDHSSMYKNYLTSCVWQWEHFYIPRILEVLQNKFVSQQYWFGVESGMIGLAPMADDVPQSTRDVVEKELERLKDGSFDVFYGPIEDNQGNIRIGEGESMTDEDMLKNFNWYVKGVVDE